MKKSLIALAVLGAFAGVGTAQAADSVQLYGIIDLGVEHFNNDGAHSVTKLGTGVQSGSRIGLKGTEDLGGGLKAMFQAETGFCANGSYDKSGYCTGGGFMGRTSMVGLSGGFGSIALGRLYTLTFNDAAKYDPFGIGFTGSAGNINGGGWNAFFGTSRVSQTLAYMSPDLAGFDVKAAYVFGDGLGGGQPGNAYANNGQTTGAYQIHGGYNNGPVSAALDYTRVNQSNGSFALKHWLIGASYDFGIAKPSFMYADYKVPVIGGENTWKAWLLGVTAPVGPGALLASYGQVKNNDMSNTTSRQWAIGYTYALSKRTNLYTSYARMTNDSNVANIVNDATGNNSAPLGPNGLTSSGFALGIRHQF